MNTDNLIENIARKNLQEGQYKDLEWIIKKSGKEISRGLIGTREHLKNIPNSSNPIYRIYSMTKPLISFAALRAVEMQKLQLYDRVDKFIDGFGDCRILKKNGRLKKSFHPMTIEHLLTHRSGLSYGFNRNCYVGQNYAKDCLIHNSQLPLKDFVNKIAEYPLAFEPGTQWRYSLSIDVLAYILELIFDDDLENILSALITEPLEMKDTKYFVPKTKANRIMPIYGEPNLDKVTDEKSSKTDLQKASLDDFYPHDKARYQARGGHGLFSTASDYSKFAEMLLDGKDTYGKPMLSKVMLDFVLKNRLKYDQIPIMIDEVPHCGYGWNLLGRIMVNSNESLIAGNNGEFGWSGAASTYFWVDPTLKVTGVLMTQVLGSTAPIGENFRATSYTCL